MTWATASATCRITQVKSLKQSRWLIEVLAGDGSWQYVQTFPTLQSAQRWCKENGFRVQTTENLDVAQFGRVIHKRPM